MSADLLRRAAEKLREHASRVSSAPWRLGIVYGSVVSDAGTIIRARNAADAEYCETLHPPVALALAELLERIYVMPQIAVMPSIQEYAEGLARAILREES